MYNKTIQFVRLKISSNILEFNGHINGDRCSIVEISENYQVPVQGETVTVKPY